MKNENQKIWGSVQALHFRMDRLFAHLGIEDEKPEKSAVNELLDE